MAAAIVADPARHMVLVIPAPSNPSWATYLSLFAVLFDRNVRVPAHLPRHIMCMMHSNLFQRAMRKEGRTW
eukprot:326519-Pelagomonas_calceolata.AAC.1